MKVASATNADDVSVRLCFLVNVRNASGRKVAGGRRIGKIVDGLNCGWAIGFVLRGNIGCTGVPNAGDEEGFGFDLATLVAGTAKFAMIVQKKCMEETEKC
jgi:hypothetical protein